MCVCYWICNIKTTGDTSTLSSVWYNPHRLAFDKDKLRPSNARTFVSTVSSLCRNSIISTQMLTSEWTLALVATFAVTRCGLLQAVSRTSPYNKKTWFCILMREHCPLQPLLVTTLVTSRVDARLFEMARSATHYHAGFCAAWNTVFTHVMNALA